MNQHKLTHQLSPNDLAKRYKRKSRAQSAEGNPSTKEHRASRRRRQEEEDNDDDDDEERLSDSDDDEEEAEQVSAPIAAATPAETRQPSKMAMLLN